MEEVEQPQPNAKRVIKRRSIYPEEVFEHAVTAVRKGMTIKRASDHFNVPRTSLRRRVLDDSYTQVQVKQEKEVHFAKLRHEMMNDPRKTPRLGWKLENELADLLLRKLDSGEEMKHSQIVKTAVEFLPPDKKIIWSNGRPGKKWVTLFLKRHPDLAEKIAKNNSNAAKGYSITSEGSSFISNLNIPITAQERYRSKLPNHELEVVPVRPLSLDQPLRSPPPLLWCGSQDPSYLCAENLVECELRPSSPLQNSMGEAEGNGAKTLMRPPNPLFIGRNMEMHQLVSSVTSRTPDQLYSAVITGPAGIGKTELVLHSILKFENFQHVIWICGNNPEASFQTASRLLSSDTNDLVRGVFSACSPQSTLVIYDNIASPEQLQQWLPPLDVELDHVTILITSQYTEWECDFHLCLEPLVPHEGLHILIENIPSVPTDIAQEISKRLNHLPLALQLVIQYKLHENKLTSEDKMPESKDPYDFLYYRLCNNEKSGYSKSLIEILDQSIDVISEAEYGMEAIKILNVIAYMRPLNSSIDLNALKCVRFNGTALGGEAVSEILDILQKYSLIQTHNSNPIMYRIYKAILRAKFNNDDEILKELSQIFVT